MAVGNGVVTTTIKGLVSAGEDDMIPNPKVETLGSLKGCPACGVSVSNASSDVVWRRALVVSVIIAVAALSSAVLEAGMSSSGLSRA